MLFPDAGKLFPDAGKLSPDAGKLSPDAGKLSPDAGKLSPDTGKLSPDAGKLFPDTGMLSPDTGMLFPCIWKATLFYGKWEKSFCCIKNSFALQPIKTFEKWIVLSIKSGLLVFYGWGSQRSRAETALNEGEEVDG